MSPCNTKVSRVRGSPYDSTPCRGGKMVCRRTGRTPSRNPESDVCLDYRFRRLCVGPMTMCRDYFLFQTSEEPSFICRCRRSNRIDTHSSKSSRRRVDQDTGANVPWSITLYSYKKYSIMSFTQKKSQVLLNPVYLHLHVQSLREGPNITII